MQGRLALVFYMNKEAGFSLLCPLPKEDPTSNDIHMDALVREQ
jgi:hypothetical protein